MNKEIKRFERETKINLFDFVRTTPKGKLIIDLDDLLAIEDGNTASGNDKNQIIELLKLLK